MGLLVLRKDRFARKADKGEWREFEHVSALVIHPRSLAASSEGLCLQTLSLASPIRDSFVHDHSWLELKECKIEESRSVWIILAANCRPL
jgi:hypothetical protein